MDAALFMKMLSDESITNLTKLKYKYPEADMGEFLSLLRESAYRALPLPDFRGNALAYLPGTVRIPLNALKPLALPREERAVGLKAREEEIAATLSIESIDFSRESVRRILQGYAPADKSEERIYGLKKGLDYIAAGHEITEENLFTLYDMAVGQHLEGDDRLRPGARYRHDNVYVVGQELDHTGLPHGRLPEYMGRLLEYAQSDSGEDDWLKAAVLHFYLAYLHPYFDGNGRMARLLHLWFLTRRGWPSALFIPFSSSIERSRKRYYQAFSLCERNAAISGVLDVTPFLSYFTENVYGRLDDAMPKPETLAAYRAALDSGRITEKERELWSFVLSAYGSGDFSTKQLERDFGHAAYATIRGFVLKFTELELLRAQKYGNRVKYRVIT